MPSPEFALLLDAIRPRRGAVVRTGGWDDARWDRVLSLAEWHRLTPLLHRSLSERHQTPARVRGALEEAYFSNAARNLFLSAALSRILDALAGANTPAMPLKGAALVGSVYADPALRVMCDLDVLVPLPRLDAANAALAEIGYRPASAAADETETASWMRVHHHHDPSLVDEHELAPVELHHHVAREVERTHFEIAGMWQRARQADGPPPHVLPSSEDLLLHVCLHFTRGQMAGSYSALARLCDIAWIIDRQPPDWDAFAEIARSYRLEARIFLALFAAHDLGLADAGPGLDALRPPGFDPRTGRRMVRLRVLRDDGGVPVRRLNWMLAPPREALVRGWDADPRDRLSLARAYVRRARAQVPYALAALKQPLAVVQDYRLNAEIEALEHVRASPASPHDTATAPGEAVR